MQPEDSSSVLREFPGCLLSPLRAGDDTHESLGFLAENLIAMVARRHSRVQEQHAMNL